MALELASGLASTEADRLLQAEALVRSWCGWHIAPERPDETVTVRASDARTLLLPTLHLTAVTSVTDDGVRVAGDAYDWTPAGVLLRSSGCWSSGPIVVTFAHGFAEAPADVSAVVQSVAQRAVQNPGSLVRKQVGPFADTYSQTGSNQSLPLALLDAEKDILGHYRLPPRP